MNDEKNISVTPKHAYSHVPNKQNPALLSIFNLFLTPQTPHVN